MALETGLVEKRIILKGIDPVSFFGTQDANLRFLEKFLNAQVIASGNEVVLRGAPEDVEFGDKVINELILDRKSVV